jgi:hypothetical protein
MLYEAQLNQEIRERNNQFSLKSFSELPWVGIDMISSPKSNSKPGKILEKYQ